MDVKQFILSVLPEIDESKASAAAEHADALGVKSPKDFDYLETDDLSSVFALVEARKILKAAKFSDNTSK